MAVASNGRSDRKFMRWSLANFWAKLNSDSVPAAAICVCALTQAAGVATLAAFAP